MSRVALTDDAEENLFALHQAASDLQRRVLRMVARGHFNQAGVTELRHKVQGMMERVEEISNEVPVA